MWDWLQSLIGNNPAAAGASAIPGIDMPLDQIAQAKLAEGSPYQQDRLAAITQGLAKGPGGGMDKLVGRMGNMGEKMILQGLMAGGQTPPRVPGPRAPAPQIRPPVAGPGLQNVFQQQTKEEEERKRRQGGRFMFQPSIY